MLEEAALRLQEQSQSRKDGRISNEDILRLTNLRCARNALKHICDIKGRWWCLSAEILLTASHIIRRNNWGDHCIPVFARTCFGLLTQKSDSSFNAVYTWKVQNDHPESGQGWFDGGWERGATQEWVNSLHLTTYVQWAPVGQLRAACELVGHYLSPTLRDMLYASYEYAYIHLRTRLLWQVATALRN